MQKILKFSSMFIVLAVAVVASMFVLDIITMDVAKDAVFKTVFIILILAISSLLITTIGGSSKK